MEMEKKIKQEDEITSKTHKFEENKYNNIRIWKQKQNSFR